MPPRKAMIAPPPRRVARAGVSPEDRLRPHAPKVLAALIALAVIAAWLNRFVQDDAFISFHYARNLVSGEGLTWYGSHIEGYTNFLWVLWIALGIGMGIDPVVWSYIGGLASFGVLLHVTWRTARLVLGDAVPALLAVLLLAGNYTTLAYATGGLETMGQTALLAAAVLQLVRLLAGAPARPRRAAGLSLLLGAAILARMDSAIPAAIVGAAALWTLWRRRASPAVIASLIAPAALLLGAWFIWKVSYYGEILPNTFHAKVGLNAALLSNGLTFVGRYLQRYWIWPLLVVGALIRLFEKRRPAFPASLLVLLCLVWTLYVVLVGGDFMEFRFLVPIAPYVSILLSGIIYGQIGSRLARRRLLIAGTAGILLLAASIHHALTFKGLTADRTLDSIGTLATCYEVYPDRRWDHIGTALRAAFPEGAPVLALHAVGAIPYYSGLRTVDMWGLNDRRVIAEGNPAPASYRRPGHQRHATLEYLRESGVNFIIAHPTLITRGALSRPEMTARLQGWVVNAVQFNREPIAAATLLAMPVDASRSLLIWHLQPTAAVDEIVAQAGWERRVISFSTPR